MGASYRVIVGTSWRADLIDCIDRDLICIAVSDTDDMVTCAVGGVLPCERRERSSD